MLNILFIAFEFPPLNRGGVFRSVSFVKYLSQYDINPVVITVSRDSYDNVYDIYTCDDSLGKDVVDKSDILYAKATKSNQQSRIKQFFSVYFSIHGVETKNWKEDFYRVAEKAIKDYNIKGVFATVPPFSVLPLALKVASSHNLPLIYDFRDAWSQWRMVPYGTRAHYWVNLFYERKYFSRANAIIATSTVTLNDFKRLHAGVDKNKFHYIPNGYNGAIEEWQTPDFRKDEIVIGYVGGFYYTPEAREQMLMPWWKKKGHRVLQYVPQKQDWLYRSPYFFFQALKMLEEKYPQIAKKIRVKFVGKKPYWLEDMIKASGLENKIELVGELPHAKAIAFQKECDMLLITSSKRIGGKDYSIAGKTYEYIQSQRPILAFVSESAQKDILADSGIALMCNPDNISESAEQIRHLAEGKLTLRPNHDFIKTLSREYLTEKLSHIIHKVIEGN